MHGEQTTDQLLDLRDWQRVSALEPDAAARFVTEACDRFVVDIDGETIVRTGVALASASHGAAADAAFAWFDCAPTPARLVVLSLLVGGLWTSPAHCTDERVDRLLRAHDALRLDRPDEYWFARALATAVTCGAPLGSEVLARLRASFHEALDRVPGDIAAGIRGRVPRR